MNNKFNKAIKAIERNTNFRVTAVTDKETAFFVTVAKDGKTVISPCFELTRDKILKLATIKR